MTTAFQNTAFQNNAFQIDVSLIVGGHFLVKGKKRTWSNIRTIYEKAKALSPEDTKELHNAVSEFVEVIKTEELPNIGKVNYDAIFENDAAYEKFLAALDDIQNKLSIIDNIQKEDDELLLIAILACTFN